MGQQARGSLRGRPIPTPNDTLRVRYPGSSGVGCDLSTHEGVIQTVVLTVIKTLDDQMTRFSWRPWFHL